MPRISTTERLSAALRQADVVKFALLQQLCQRTDDILDGNTTQKPTRLEQVDLLRASKSIVALVNAVLDLLLSGKENVSIKVPESFREDSQPELVRVSREAFLPALHRSRDQWDGC